jgi:hypothetical protein
VAVSNAIATPGYFMPRGTRLSEFETTCVQLRGGRQASIRPCVLGAQPVAAQPVATQRAAAQISPKHVRVMTNVVTDALTGIPPSAQERRT